MSNDNGAATRAPHSECLAANRLVGVMFPPAPSLAPADLEPAGTGTYNACDAGFLRTHPAEVLDLVGAGKTVEIRVDLARDAAPIAVIMPWRDYEEFCSIRAKISAITGTMQRAG
jgi:antitoxin (DNA-binding transcriptional repressor) of toxin-antitoxin stability system